MCVTFKIELFHFGDLS